MEPIHRRPTSRPSRTAILAIAIAAMTAGSAPAASGTVRTISESDARASRIIGATVSNPANEKLGTIDDLVISHDRRVTYAVLAVGGVLGIGAKRVAVPYGELAITADGVIYDRTADQVKALPEFASRAGVPAAGGAPDHDAYLQRAGKRMGEWEQRVAAFKQSADEGRRKASETFGAAWGQVKDSWADLESASKDHWDTARRNFERAWDRFEKAWVDAQS
jgi:hypothetical protein